MELTEAQLAKAKSASLEELRQMALNEAVKPIESPVEQPRESATGRFAKGSQLDHFDLPDDETGEVAPQPTAKRFRIVTDVRDDGHIREVFEADSEAELISKLTDAKRHANQAIRELSQKRRELEARLGQVSDDQDFIWQQKLKESPRDVLLSAADQALDQRENAREAEKQREAERVAASTQAQLAWVSRHSEYNPVPGNADKLISEMKRLGHAKITEAALEQAYNNVKGSLEAKPAPEPPPPPGPRRTGSSLSIRNGPWNASSKRGIGPSLEELYDPKKYTTEQVREIAERSMRENNKWEGE